MKRFPQIDRFFTALCSFLILALFVLLSSCEKESLQDDASRIKVQKLETASLRILMSYNDCSSSCIIEGSETYYAKSDSKTVSTGNTNVNGKGNTNTKNVSYKAYNTETEFIVEVYYEITEGNSNAHAKITIYNDDDSEYFGEVASGSMVSHAFNLPNGWKSCDLFSFNILQEELGDDIQFSDSYSLIEVCSSSCDESFNYIQNEDGSYTFTYVSNEDLEDAEVKFTCPHIKGFEALDDKEYIVNPGNSHGSPTVLTWNGDINACSEITFTLSFEADCEQNNAGKANLFTDFKVNGVSKKGANENIVFACPE